MYSMRVREGDLVIVATDGLYDNVFLKDILDIVKRFTKSNKVKTKSSAHLLAR